MLLTTDCETVAVGYDEVYSRSLLGASALDRRVQDVDRFWRRWQSGACDAAVVSRYDVSYVVAPAAGAPPARCGSTPVLRVRAEGPHATFAASRLQAR